MALAGNHHESARIDRRRFACLATLTVSLWCCRGASPSAPAPPSDSQTTLPAPSASNSPSLVDTIPSTWRQLEGLAHRIYIGSWSLEIAPPPPLVCVTPIRIVHGDASSTKRVCERASNLLTGLRWDPAPINQRGWVFTTKGSGRETIRAIAPDRASLLEQVRCRRLDRIWSHMPPQHRSCSEAKDCLLLHSQCFTVALAKSAAAPYRRVVERFGGACLDPAGGVCPPSQATAQCVDHRCAAVEP